MVINKDFKEFVESLNAHNVRYLIVGGYAVAYHGRPRYTNALDVWIATDTENRARLISALAAFGFSSLKLQTDDFKDPETVVQLGYPPHRIDLLTGLKGVDFEKCWSTRCQVRIQDAAVNFIDLDSLKKNKQATGRHQDLADLEHLQ